MAVIPVASTSSRPQPPPFDATKLDEINSQLADATPQEILKWATDNLPGLYQTTAFGLTGLAAVDMIHRISKRQKAEHLVPLIFIDTLYHFKETLQLAQRVEKKYGVKLTVYKPPGVENVEEFEAKYGEKLWETDEETYDYLVKVSFSSLAYSVYADAY
jgi:phosphoadenosine phosphosulfate reductase